MGISSSTINQCCCPSRVEKKIKNISSSIDLGSGCSSLRCQARFRARLIDPFRLTSSPLFLPSLGLSFALPSLAATTGRAAAPFITSSPSPFPATSILKVCPPLLFPSAVRDGAPQTLTKLFLFGSESSSIYYLLISMSFAKVIGCTHVHPCPMLGPPPGSTDLLLCDLMGSIYT